MTTGQAGTEFKIRGPDQSVDLKHLINFRSVKLSDFEFLILSFYVRFHHNFHVLKAPLWRLDRQQLSTTRSHRDSQKNATKQGKHGREGAAEEFTGRDGTVPKAAER